METNTKEQTKENKSTQQTLEQDGHHADEMTTEQSDKKSRFKRYPARKFPIYLRIIVVLVLLIVSALLGLIVGYAFFGDGTITDALKIDTYRHIYDLIYN